MSQSGFGRVFYDVSELFELQWQLFKADSSEAKKTAIPAIALLGVCLALTLVTAVTLAFSMTWAIHEYGQLRLSLSFLITATFFAFVSLLIAWLSLRGMAKTAAYFDDSRSEFSENMRWLRATILNPDSPRNQMALRQSESVQRASSDGFRGS